jgi:hypothetical protein
MEETEPSARLIKIWQIRTQDLPVYKRLGFHIGFGTQWFEASPAQIKEYFYEIAIAINTQSYLDDISFSTVFDMSTLGFSEGEHQPPIFETNLYTMTNSKANEEARLDMLKAICLTVIDKPEHEGLRDRVIELLEADLRTANITWRPDDSLHTKVCQHPSTSEHRLR